MKRIHNVLFALTCLACRSLALEISTPKCELLGAFKANNKGQVVGVQEETITADFLTKFPGMVQAQLKNLMTSSEGKGKAEVLSKASEIIETFRKNPASSLWPKSLSREKPVTLHEYFLGIMGEGNYSIHYAKTLRNFWSGRQQLIEMDLPNPRNEDVKKFQEALEQSLIFEAAAIYHGVPEINLIGGPLKLSP